MTKQIQDGNWKKEFLNRFLIVLKDREQEQEFFDFMEATLKKAIDRAVDLALPNEKMVKEKDLCKQLYAEFNITNKEEEK